MENHEKECECACCRDGEEAFREREREIIEKHGWLIHFVTEPDGLGLVNVHTHNIDNFLGHPDFQIVYPLEPNVAGGILHGLVDKIKEGSKFKEGDEANGILKGMPVGFMAVKEGNRFVLRVILPDTDGVVARGKIAKPFDLQFQTEDDVETDEF